MNHSGAGSRPRGGMGWPQQWTVLADLAAVLVFVAIGLSAHGHKESAANLAQVSAPFLVVALVGHALARLRGVTPTSAASGVVVVAATVAFGQVLRVIFGQGTAISFIAVSLAFNAFVMIGWRLAWAAMRHGALISRGS